MAIPAIMVGVAYTVAHDITDRGEKRFGYFCSVAVSGAGVSFAAADCPSVSSDKGRTGGFFSLNKILSRIGQTIEEITMSIIVAIRGSIPPSAASMFFAMPVS